MRQKELRLALICYGGVSLAVYMHGITKEVWKLARSSRDFHENRPCEADTRCRYRTLLERIESEKGLRLRVLPDIISGASAGGINGVFLAQAIATGQSLEPLTDMWLETADVDQLLDPDARPLSRFTKFWAEPIAWYAAGRKGGAVEQTVSAEARSEVQMKLSKLVRARWFQPPFGGATFCHLVLDALDKMAAAGSEGRLLPPEQPLDLFVTVTDYTGHPERLQLNSPPVAFEMEHRITISFAASGQSNRPLANAAELTFASRATSCFPGAFPPFAVGELDAVLAKRQQSWPGRSAFLERILPHQSAAGLAEQTVLIDGSVLANAPFAQAIGALKNRPARREVDRRFVYIDPRPDLQNSKQDRVVQRARAVEAQAVSPLPGFFSTIFAAISNIPREQPIRDNLNSIAARSNRIMQMRRITDNLRADVETQVEALLGGTLFLDSPTPARLNGWRAKAHDKATKLAGFSYAAYAHLKMATVIDEMADAIHRASGAPDPGQRDHIRKILEQECERRGLNRVGTSTRTKAAPELITFFREHDLGFRIRRLRFLARRLAADADQIGELTEAQNEALHDRIFAALALYIERETPEFLHVVIDDIGELTHGDGGRLLGALSRSRNLQDIDAQVDQMLSDAFAPLPKSARRSQLLAYLGFPFYDIATLPLLQGEGLDEFDPIKVDRISPDDAQFIRTGDASATLKGIEFNSFGAFFSRTYRENDYLWGRLHGAERMVDILLSTLPKAKAFAPSEIATIKAELFHAILDEEGERLSKLRAQIPALRAEIDAGLAQAIAVAATAPDAASWTPHPEGF